MTLDSTRRGPHRVRIGLRTLATTAIAGAFALALIAPVSAQVNTAPVAGLDTATTAEDTAVTIPVLANDEDGEDDDLDVTAVTAAAHGTVVLNADNTVRYTPAANYNGPDAFFYTLSDGALTATGTVSVTVTAVNDRPVAGDDSATTKKNTAVVIDVLANDSDVETAKSSLLLSSGEDPDHGTVTFGADRKVTYTPDTGYVGSDTFTYVLSDGSLSDTGTVSVTVKEQGTGTGDLNERVVAGCEAYEGSDMGITTLCRLYLSDQLPPWAQERIGKILLERLPKADKPNRIAVACVDATNTAVMRLCVLYLDDTTPDWLKDSVGKLILRITNADDDRRHDARGQQDSKEPKSHKDNKGNKGNKGKNSGTQAIANAADDKTDAEFRAWWIGRCDKNGDGVVDEADFAEKRGKKSSAMQAVADTSDDRDDDRRSERSDKRDRDDDRRDGRDGRDGKHRKHR